jgi:DNA replicative helicase MCM subunit Mcm2 (Cdc46/Mcm family)
MSEQKVKPVAGFIRVTGKKRGNIYKLSVDNISGFIYYDDCTEIYSKSNSESIVTVKELETEIDEKLIESFNTTIDYSLMLPAVKTHTVECHNCNSVGWVELFDSAHARVEACSECNSEGSLPYTIKAE